MNRPSEHDPLVEALKSLPHGPEFRFVDRLTSLAPGREGVGEYTVRGDEPFLRGHFPGEPLLPGVLLIEAAAQLAGVVAQSDATVPPLAGLKLTALRAVKITGTARPGETVVFRAQVVQRLGPLIHAVVRATLAETTILSAEVTLSGLNQRDDESGFRGRTTMKTK
jgi:3-hydroxyacyl-[acyl-carrier-protein] dehydratase